MVVYILFYYEIFCVYHTTNNTALHAGRFNRRGGRELFFEVIVGE